MVETSGSLSIDEAPISNPDAMSRDTPSPTTATPAAVMTTAEALDAPPASSAAETGTASTTPADADVADVASPSAARGEEIPFRITWGKHVNDVTRLWDSTVGELKLEIEKTLNIPSSAAKLMLAGKLLKDDSATLRQAGLKSGTKLMLIGTSAAELAGGKRPAPSGEAGEAAWDAPPTKEEPLCKQTQHAKVLAKGKPDDALPGIKGRQVPLADEVTMLPGMLNSQGSKVRLTFKPEINQLWIGTAQHTQKVALNSIAKIESWPIDDQEEYSIVSMQIGSSTQSRLWLYYVPSQYVSGIKLRILGIMSLI